MCVMVVSHWPVVLEAGDFGDAGLLQDDWSAEEGSWHYGEKS